MAASVSNPTYGSEAPTTVDAGSSNVLDRAWIMSIPSYIKIGEIVNNVVVFICASVWADFVTHFGGGWVQFVSMTALVCTILLYICYAFNMQQRLSTFLPVKTPWDLWELIYNASFSLFYFIAGVVSAVYGDRHSSIGASAFFCFAGMLIYGADAFFSFQRYRGALPPTAPPPSGGFSPPTMPDVEQQQQQQQQPQQQQQQQS